MADGPVADAAVIDPPVDDAGVAAPVILLAPTRVEAHVMGSDVVVTGTGSGAVAAVVERLRRTVRADLAVAVTGTAERLHPGLRPGQLVVADEVRLSGGVGAGRRALPSAGLLAAELRREGHDVVVGPVVTADCEPGELAIEERSALASSGALVLDHHSAWAAALAGDDGPLAVVRVVEDLPGPGAMAALDTRRVAASLAGVRGPIERWARACRSRRVVLAAPRSFCAGVERAIEIVERALDRYGPPVYVRRQIVHNTHVVSRLAAKGAVFVEELDEVPDTATVVLAAHGVSPGVRQEAAGRQGFQVIDATCPLVAKVHHEARRYAARDYDIVLIGHGDHEEVVGTVGEAPDRTHLVASAAEVGDLVIGPDRTVAYLTQTTLATDETAEVIEALRRRFPDIVGPSADDICYATQNRQDAVRAIAGQCDLVLVVGSANSSNTARLVEVARREGCRAELVEDAGQLRLSWLDGAATVGLTAGASAPESLVEEVVVALGRLGPLDLHEQRTTTETVRFSLPLQVR